jgi:hypothetical protein
MGRALSGSIRWSPICRVGVVRMEHPPRFGVGEVELARHELLVPRVVGEFPLLPTGDGPAPADHARCFSISLNTLAF